MSPLVVQRKQQFDQRRQEFIDEVLRTLQLKRYAHTAVPSAGATIGSHRIGAGSMLRLTEVNLSSGSANYQIAWVFRGTPLTPHEQRGTIDSTYFAARGEARNIYDLDKNAPAFGQGSLLFISVEAGTKVNIAFRGIERSVNTPVTV